MWLEPFAAGDIGDARRKEANDDDDHQQIEHGNASGCTARESRSAPSSCPPTNRLALGIAAEAARMTTRAPSPLTITARGVVHATKAAGGKRVPAARSRRPPLSQAPPPGGIDRRRRGQPSRRGDPAHRATAETARPAGR